MSPSKRSLQEVPDLQVPKRLRGGGMDEAPPFEDDDVLFDEEEILPPEELVPEEVLEEAAADLPEQAQQRCKRPNLPADFSNAQDLNLQWIDMDVTTGQPLKQNPNKNKKAVGATNDSEVPVLRCYGVDEKGHSVATFIHGFTPYAYFALPCAPPTDPAVKRGIREKLNTELIASARGARNLTNAVVGVDFVHNHRSIFGYQTPHVHFLKVYVALPNLVPALKRVMENGIVLKEITDSNECYAPFECNVPFVLRFMIDHNISGAGWLSLKSETYTVRPANAKKTHCQVS